LRGILHRNRDARKEEKQRDPVVQASIEPIFNHARLDRRHNASDEFLRVKIVQIKGWRFLD
jgi:hypothetical protein